MRRLASIGCGRHPNGTEREFLEWYFASEAVAWGRVLFEALTFRLPGGSRYTPDWVHTQENGGIYCYEVKGSFKLWSHGRALTAFREARAAFPLVRFRWFEKQKGGGFVEKYAEGEKHG